MDDKKLTKIKVKDWSKYTFIIYTIIFNNFKVHATAVDIII